MERRAKEKTRRVMVRERAEGEDGYDDKTFGLGAFARELESPASCEEGAAASGEKRAKWDSKSTEKQRERVREG